MLSDTPPSQCVQLTSALPRWLYSLSHISCFALRQRDMYGTPEGTWQPCKITQKAILILKQCGCIIGSLNGSEIDIDGVYRSPFSELYVCMGLTYEDIKSFLGSRYGFNISKRHLKGLPSARGLSHCKVMLRSSSRKSASSVSVPPPTAEVAACFLHKLGHQFFKMQLATLAGFVRKTQSNTQIIWNNLSQLQTKVCFMSLYPGCKRHKQKQTKKQAVLFFFVLFVLSKR